MNKKEIKSSANKHHSPKNDSFFKDKGITESEQPDVQTFFNPKLKKSAKTSTSFFNGNIIQTNLKIGRPNDKFEQEADAMSEKVVQKMDSSSSIAAVQKESQSEKEKLQTKEEERENTQINTSPIFESEQIMRLPFVQEKGIDQVEPGLKSQLEKSKENGRPIDEATRGDMEQNFGTGFSNVKVHTGQNAVQMNQQLNSKAFTNGSDIYFNNGYYNPRTREGNKLLAHELTHVVQQGASSKPNNGTGAGKNQDHLQPPGQSATKNATIFKQEISGYYSNSTVSTQSMSSVPAIQRQHVLENDPSTIPAGMNCPVSFETLTDPGASLEITFNRAGSVLTAEDVTNIAVFVNNWQNAGVKVPVRIHGYASKDGSPGINWPLSCRRATAVASQMQKVQPAVALSTGQTFPAGTPGIPTGFIQNFAHGETEDFSNTALKPNRRAMVHVPTLPTLPAKVTTPPKVALKSGPTYTLNAQIATPTTKSADFDLAAEFDHDPVNGVLGACGQVRQYIRWSNNNVDPGRVKGGAHEGFLTDKTYQPGVWYEDRDQQNTRYGHRSGPHSLPILGVDQYFDKAGGVSPNTATGRFYEGNDSPGITNSKAVIASFVGTWEFKLDAIDTCNGNKVLGTDFITIKW